MCVQCVCECLSDFQSPNYLIQPGPLDPQGVLVDGNHSLVQQQCLGLGLDVAKVVGHVERGCHDRPHSHLHFLLLIAQSIVTNNDLEKRVFRQSYLTEIVGCM